MKSKTPNLLNLILSVLLGLGVMTVFRACAAMEDGTWMHCHTVQLDVFYLAIALAVLSGIALCVKNKRGVVICLNIVQIVAAVVALLLPGTIMSMCMMEEMRCHAVMKPFVLVMCVLIAVCALWSILGSAKRK